MKIKKKISVLVCQLGTPNHIKNTLLSNVKSVGDRKPNRLEVV